MTEPAPMTGLAQPIKGIPPLSWRVNIFVLFAYLLVAILLLGPLHPGREMWGGATDDFFEHVQLLWWQAHQAARGNPFPLFTTDLAYPDGGAMFLPDPIGGAFAVPFVWLLGTAPAFNLLTLADLVFAAWAMRRLVRRRTGDGAAAFLAGTLYGFSPVLLGNVHNGITETIQAGWLPLFLDSLLTLLDEARRPTGRRRAAWLIFLTGLTWALTALGQWYYGIYACLLFGLVVPVKAVWPWSWRSWLYAGAALGLFAILIFPPAWLFIGSVRGGGSLFYLGSMDFYITQPDLLLSHSADPAFLFAARPDFENYLHLGYVGFATTAMLLLGLARRRRATLGWLLGAVFFIILSWGPLLGWHSRAVAPAPGGNAFLPYTWFYHLIPFFKEMRLPYRFFIAVHLLLAMAIGSGLAGWLPEKRKRTVVFLAFTLAALAETAFLSGAHVPADRQRPEVSPLLAELAADPEAGAVMDLPFHFGPAARGAYLVGQTVHHRPIVYGIQGRDFAPSLRANLAINVLFEASQTGTILEPARRDLFRGQTGQSARELTACLGVEEPCPAPSASRLRQALSSLLSLKINTFVVHRPLLAESPDQPPLERLCQTLFGSPIAQDAQVTVYRLDEDDLDE